MIPMIMPKKNDVVTWTYSGVVTIAVVLDIDNTGKATVQLLQLALTEHKYEWDFVNSDSAKDPNVSVCVIGKWDWITNHIRPG